MDILIPNIEVDLSKQDLTIMSIHPDGRVLYTPLKGKLKGKMRSTKAVALPEHGDLIDEDEFRLVIYREIRNHKEDEQLTTILKGILWEMDNAPVIVEATE